MEERRKTVAALTVLAGITLLVALIVGFIASSKKTVSPIPEEGAIRVIFISPTIIPAVTNTPIVTPTGTKK